MGAFPATWAQALDAPARDALARAEAHVTGCEACGVTVYPPPPLRYRALDEVAPQDVAVVILGQDPYHGPGQAMGLAFSVPMGMRVPPSLANVYKELAVDLGLPRARDGDLTGWATQGVLLLNTSLSVEQGKPASHAAIGWETVTDRLIAHVSEHAQPTAFLLWGRHAQTKAPLIDAGRHLVLQAGHPSPLSARKFLGCRHFSAANAFLEKHGRPPVNWRLPTN